MLQDLDRVALTRDIPEHDLVVGDLGAIVHIYADGKAYEVEFVGLAGETIAIVTLPAEAVRAVAKGEIANARMIAAA